MREQGAVNNTPYVQIGVVISADPLILKLGDLQIGKENLLVAAELMPGYVREYSSSGNLKLTDSGSLGATDSASVPTHGSHSHDVTALALDTDNTQTGDITLTDGLQVDDTVALIPALDGQTYIVLAKVVRP